MEVQHRDETGRRLLAVYKVVLVEPEEGPPPAAYTPQAITDYNTDQEEGFLFSLFNFVFTRYVRLTHMAPYIEQERTWAQNTFLPRLRRAGYPEVLVVALINNINSDLDWVAQRAARAARAEARE